MPATANIVRDYRTALDRLKTLVGVSAAPAIHHPRVHYSAQALLSQVEMKAANARGDKDEGDCLNELTEVLTKTYEFMTGNIPSEYYEEFAKVVHPDITSLMRSLKSNIEQMHEPDLDEDEGFSMRL